MDAMLPPAFPEEEEEDAEGGGEATERGKE